MTILEDVNQKIGKHDNIAEWCRQNGVTIRRQKLNVGDYQSPPRVAVDTKYGMAEIYQDIVNDHDRFRAECIRAQEDDILLYILIEEENIKSLDDAEKWENPRKKKYDREYGLVIRAQQAGKMLNHKIPKPPVSSERLVGMMRAMELKYGCKFEFCHPSETGRRIFELLSSKR